MICCDEYLLGKLSQHLSYEDLVLANGFANSMRTFSYGGVKIRFPCGRWDIDFLNVLNALDVKYQIRKVSDLPKCTCYDHLIALVPKEFLENWKKLKRNVIQIGLVYSAFQIIGCDGEYIRLQLSGSEDKGTIACCRDV